MAEKFNVLGRHGKESFAKLKTWTLIKRKYWQLKKL